MALLRKLFYRNPPDGLLEISERVYVFNCCYSTDVLEEKEYKAYIGATVGQLREHLPDASFMVFNFREGENQSQLANILAEHNMIVMDYPRHYEGCPLLSMEMIHHFLRSSESWLSLGQQNVLLMHCERGGWPVLAFMLASLLIYRKQYSGEQKTLDMVCRQAPKELLQLMTPVNPLPSQLRYLQYVSRRNVSTEWPPSDRALTLDCIIIRFIPNLDGDGGFRPIFRIYGQDPLMASDRIPKVLFSTPKRSKLIRYFKQADCELAKIDIRCHIQGDVVLECINLDEDLEREEMIFRVMFNTAFIRSNILMLGRNEIDSLWNAKDQFPKDFRTEVLFSEMNLATSLISMDFPSIEEREELPIEAFAKVHEIFSNIDWLGSRTDETLNLLQHLKSSNALQEKLTTTSTCNYEVRNLLQLTPNKLNLESQLSDIAEETGKDKIKSSVLQISSEQAAPLSSCDSLQGSPATLDVDPPAPLASFVAAPIQDLAILNINEFTQPLAVSSPTSATSAPDVLNITKPEPGNLHILSLPSVQAPLGMPPEPPPFTVRPFAPTSPLISSTAHTEESFSTPCQSVQHQPSSDQTLPSLAQPSQKTLFGENQSSSVSLSSPSHSLSQNSPSLSAMISTTIPPSPPPPPSFSGRLQSTSVFKSLPTSLPLTSPVISETSQPSYVKNSYSAPPPPPPPPPAPSYVKLLSSAVKNSLSIPFPPPPPPAITTSVANLSSSQLETKKIAFMPAPPPPPPHFGSVLAVSVLPSVSPPAPPLLSGFSLKDSSDNTNVLAPPAPPPPAPPGNAMVKAPMQSISGASKAIPAIPGPPSSISFSAKGRGSCRVSPKNQSQNKRANLKPYHWLKLTRAMQGSLWAEAQKASEATKTPEFDMSELESLFSATVPNSDHANNGGKSKQRGSRAKSDKVQLIELRRAYNCEIMLSKVKIPLPDLMGSVLALDESALSVDQIENLIKFCPTKEEMELLKGYSGDKENLGKCEIFFLELMKVPRVEPKLRVFSFKIQFQLQVCDLRRGLNIVNSASEEIRGSLKLRRVMQTILSLGNALNQGTARGSAIGFRLDSLLKLADTRARNSKMTLVHYLCKVLAEKLPELSDFSNDLVNLEASTKIQLKYLAEEMQAISKGLEKVVQELTLAESDGPVSEYFCEALKNFLSHAEAEVRSLTSLYSNVGRNADALALYFGEDPSRCPFEQVVSTLYSFVKTFERAHEENCKQLEFEKKKMQKETEMEKLKTSFSRNVSEHSIQTPIKSGDIH